MKHFAISLYLFLSAALAGATVHSVSNAAGDVTDFSNLTDAITAASNGDTIYVQPSLTSYGNIVLDKQLFILGPGHNPAFSDFSANVGYITFISGSSGSVIKGLTIAGITGSTWHTATNIYIANNRITAQNPLFLPTGTWTNWIFEGNVIASQTNGINCQVLGEGLIFRNNILHTFAGSNVMANAGAGSLFEHNLFMITSNTVAAKVFANSQGVVARNNIIYVTPTTVENLSNGCTSCSWENNATYNPNTTVPDLPGTTNLNNTNPDFVNVTLLSPDFNYSYDYHLNPTSPLTTGGSDGGEIGFYGGVFAFSMTGEDQTLPRIIQVTPLVTTAPPGGVLSIHIEAAAAGN